MAGSSEKDPLFQPLKIKHLTLKNRIMSTSHASGMDTDGIPDEPYQRYHEEKAKGGLALTMFGGSSSVSEDSRWVTAQLRLSDDRVLPYLEQFAKRIHAQDCAIMCQITHLGRRADPVADHWMPTVAPSAVRETLHRSIPREIDSFDIRRIIRDFGNAAKRCEDAGLDGLETHAGGHLIGQFFSPDVNQRHDQYGGNIENRARFALEVHEEIRKRVGDKFLLGLRMSIGENRDGLSEDDAIKIAQLLEREGAIDFLNCVYGRMDTELFLAENNMPGMTMTIAPFLPKIKRMKESVSLPIFHAARITDVATARHAIRDGILDMVAMTRAHIADPQLVNKIQRGEENRIRPCLGASHCMYNRPHCIHNPAAGRETQLPQVVQPSGNNKRRVVIVGGGPAGLEAARITAERGHEVVLLEATPQLGGQIQLAAKADWRQDLIAIVDWRVSELAHLGVDVRLNTYAEAGDVLALQPDVVIIATGGLPGFGQVVGSELCLSTWDLLSGEVEPAANILVYDGTGRNDAPSCAKLLAKGGANVIYATIDDRLGGELGYPERPIYRKQFYQLGVATHIDLSLQSIEQSASGLLAKLRNELTDELIELKADQVIVDGGTTPLTEVFDGLRENSVNQGVTDIDALLSGKPQPGLDQAGYLLFRIGDAISSRSLHAALLDAYRLAINL